MAASKILSESERYCCDLSRIDDPSCAHTVSQTGRAAIACLDPVRISLDVSWVLLLEQTITIVIFWLAMSDWPMSKLSSDSLLHGTLVANKLRICDPWTGDQQQTDSRLLLPH